MNVLEKYSGSLDVIITGGLIEAARQALAADTHTIANVTAIKAPV